MMYAPPATKTSAKVPTNSATKCRNESLISRSSEDQGGVDAAEAEAVRQHVVDARVAAAPREVVQVARVVGGLQVHRRRQPLVAQRHRTDRGLERARRA